MKVLKKSLMALFVCCLMVLVVPMLSTEASAETSGDWEYSVSSGIATVTKYNGTASTVNIPEFFGAYQVRTIGDSTFSGNTQITKVVVPDSVTYIGRYAFSDCSKLKTVTLSDSLTSLNSYAFSGCVNLTSIRLPEELEWLGEKVFQNCVRLEKIVIDCQYLSRIWIDEWRNGEGRIYGQPFYGCGTATDGITVTFTETCQRIPPQLFYAYDGSAAEPNITTVNIKNGTTGIGYNAFRGCTSLTKVTLPNSLEWIGEAAFNNCVNLQSVKFPASLTKIYYYAYEGCVNLKTVTLPKSLKRLGDGAFKNCTRLEKIVVNSTDMDDVLTDGTWASNFGGDGYRYYYGQPFYGAGTATDGITVTFASGVTRIPANIFWANDGNASAPNITSVSIADTVTYIGANAFRGCIDLKTIRFAGDDPQCGENVLYGVTATAYYPNDKIWTQEGRDYYGGNITWKSYGAAKITAQPKTAYAKSGATVKTTVKATGEGLTYTWYIKNSGATKYSKSSVTSATYATTMSSSSKDRLVYCIVKDKYGATVKSNTVRLRMAATITTQPKTAYAKYGATVKTTVKAAGDGLTYQWYIKNAGATKYSKSSVTSATYATTMNNSSQGRYVYCVVTDKYGKTAKTNTVQLRMKATILTQPKTAYAKSGATVKTTVKADGDGLTYQWYVKNAGGTSYSKSANTTATYSVKMTANTKNRYVYCIVKDKYGNSVKSNTVLLRMAATITTQPKSVTVAKGSTAKVSLTAVGDGLTYTWYYKNAGATKFTKTTAFTGNTYSVAMNAARDGRQIYCVVTDKYGKTAKSNTVTLNMK